MPTPHSQRPDASARQHAIRARDAGLRRISALTRGLAAGAVGLTGTLALLAAGSFHGKTVAVTPRPAATVAAESATQGPVARSASAATTVTTTTTTTQSAAPAAPSAPPAPTPAAPVVVSGGS
jgi:cytoskeletal protein RodZ